MPRNGSGAYAPPSNSFNPAVANTTIDPAAWAQILSDLAAAITASIARDGQTATSQRIPFAAGVGLNDGAAALPALAFTGSPTTGLYASGADELAVAIDGARQVKVSEDGVELAQPLAISSGGTGATDAGAARASLGLAVGTDVQAHDADLDAVAALASAGLVARTGAGTAAARTLTGTSGEVAVANGDGVAGNPTLSLPSSLNFTGKTVTAGTFAGPTFTGTDTGAALSRTSGTFNGPLGITTASDALLTMTASGGSARVEFDKQASNNDAGFLVKQGGVIRWACGEMGSSGANTGEFLITRFGSGASGIKIDPTTYKVTVTNDFSVGGNISTTGNLIAAGVIASQVGTVSTNSGVPASFYTVPGSVDAIYEVAVTATFPAGIACATAKVVQSHGSGGFSVFDLQSISGVTVTMSGLNIQVTQTLGFAVVMAWSVRKAIMF